MCWKIQEMKCQKKSFEEAAILNVLVTTLSQLIHPYQKTVIKGHIQLSNFYFLGEGKI
jgi:hypothetical protein